MKHLFPSIYMILNRGWSKELLLPNFVEIRHLGELSCMSLTMKIPYYIWEKLKKSCYDIFNFFLVKPKAVSYTSRWLMVSNGLHNKVTIQVYLRHLHTVKPIIIALLLISRISR